MKRFLYIVTVIIISISLAACGAKKPNDTTGNTGTNSTPVSKVTYTKEIAYFPSYNEGNSEVKLSQYTPGNQKNPYATAKYTIQNTTDTKVYENYESLLKKDGWTITKDQKYFSILAKKDAHTANILIQKVDKNIVLVVISK